MKACHLAPLPWASLLCLAATAALSPAQPALPDFNAAVLPVLREHCLDCHNASKQKGDLDLEIVASPQGLRQRPRTWQRVLEQLSENAMPPDSKPRLAPAARDALLAWVRGSLHSLALESAGDPGPVVLRRLSNAEYTYTLQDLTGVSSLHPAKEFPVDGAAGEGFTNTGQALVMSPSLVTKYLDAAKSIAAQAVLLPDGFRFSPSPNRRDWTEEILTEIRAFYSRFTSVGGSDTVTQQGIALDRNKGGSLPLDKYLAAALAWKAHPSPVPELAQSSGLSPRYLQALLDLLNADQPSPLLDPLRAAWRGAAPETLPALLDLIAPWQQALWRFSSVGHIGKKGGPKAWMEPLSPLAAQQEFRLKLTPPKDGSDQIVHLLASTAGDGSQNDFALWQNPRLLIPGRPPVPLAEVRGFLTNLTAHRSRILAATAQALRAAALATSDSPGAADAMRLARDQAPIAAWFHFLGIQTAPSLDLTLFAKTLPDLPGQPAVKGWGSPETPQILANSSDQALRIPGNLKPHGVVVHPSPTLAVAVGWRSPRAASLRLTATITDAHTDCGNGVSWTLERRRGATRQRLAEGTTQAAQPSTVGPLDPLDVLPGDLLSLVIAPRNGEHSCDLTDLEFTLTALGDAPQTWSLTSDISSSILAGNPHADSTGSAGVWHFYTEPATGLPSGSLIPPNSLLARWQAAPSDAEKAPLALALEELLTSKAPAPDSPDAALYQTLTSLSSPLLATFTNPPAAPPSPWGLDPARFGIHPDSRPADPSSLYVQAPSDIAIPLPADLPEGTEFTATGLLDPLDGAAGSVQLQVLTSPPTLPLTALSPALPILTAEGSQTRQKFENALAEFRDMFPAALCYTKIVPVDEVVTLTLFHREDEALSRLILDDSQRAQLDRLWDQLHFVSEDPLTLVDAFEQLYQFATQDSDPSAFEPMRLPINQRAEAFRQSLIAAQPRHLDALLEFAQRAYRRPLTDPEQADLRALYQKLRDQDLPHPEALRLTLARVLISPSFLYRGETPAPGLAQTPVSSDELANRLSYFLWSAPPDDILRAAATSGKLRQPEELAAQTQRMLRDPRLRRLAIEFGCAWLHIRDFDALDEKSERHFPEFAPLRGAMYEESIRFFTDFLQENRSVLSLLEADHTFLNEALAKHYGIPGVTGPDWRRVDGVRPYGRGGVLALASTLSKQSGASRTSPILRGNWVAEALLGDKLPRPPKDVPRLPEDEATASLTMRQLTEKHSADPRCAGCHVRIDAFGFALEGFDAIGRFRQQDSAGRPIDTLSKTMDGATLQGLDGLRDYLATKRRDAFLHQFCKKLLGYSLGRSVQLSDQPLLAEMQTQLAAHGFGVHTAIALIVASPQFRDIRGREAPFED